jgi:hypothetical protein
MEIIQVFPTSLGKQRIQAFEDKLVVDYKNLFRSYQIEFDYKELDPKIIRGKVGDSGWFNITFFLIILILIIRFLVGMSNEVFVTALLVMAGLPAILGFIKYDYVVIDTNKAGYHLVFWVWGKHRQARENMVNFILEKIKEQNEQSQGKKP